VRVRLPEPRPASARRDQVDIAVVRVLLADARRLGLPNPGIRELSGPGGCSQDRTRYFGDHITLEITLGGASRTVRVWDPCFAPETTAALDRLAQRIEALSGALAWINDEWIRRPRWGN